MSKDTITLIANVDVPVETVLVNIEITETTRYAKQIKMPLATFKQFEDSLEAGGHFHRRATIELGGYIDPRSDFVDSETDCIDDFSIVEDAKDE